MKNFSDFANISCFSREKTMIKKSLEISKDVRKYIEYILACYKFYPFVIIIQ